MNLQESIRKDLDRLNEAPLEVTKQKISYEMVETQPTYIDYVYDLDYEETEKWIEELGHIPNAEEIKDHMLNYVEGFESTGTGHYGQSTYNITMYIDGEIADEYNL